MMSFLTLCLLILSVFLQFCFYLTDKNKSFSTFFLVFLVCIFISCLSICRYFVFHQGPHLNYRVK